MTDDLKLKEPVHFINDSPETQTPLFGFMAYAKTIASLIANQANKTPMVIGIYGSWGSGKTTLMKAVKRLLEHQERGGDWRKCQTVWFQAWKYGKEEEILSALIGEILKTMQDDGGFIKRCKPEIRELITNKNIATFLGKLSKITTGLDVSEFLMGLKSKAKPGFWDTFEKILFYIYLML